MEIVLQLESSNLFRKIVKSIVEPRGYNLIATNSSTEALEILESTKISLIITGNELIDMSGEDFIRYLSKSKFSNIPVIVLTSTDSLELRTKLFSLGIIDYILKKDISTAKLENYFDSLIKQDTLLEQIQGESIAVLDDSKFGLNVIKNIFELHKIKNVSYYTDPQNFLDNSEKYSFFLVDLVLPEISGEEIIIQLRKKQKDCIIIIVSGIANLKTVSHALMYGADDYISKPYDNSMFMARFKANARTFFLYKELEKRAITDGLTGLYNHRYIYDFVGSSIMRKKRKHLKFCVLLIDIDHFKNVNDSYGHQVGDLVLMNLSQKFDDSFGDDAVCGRYGGEEFMAILQNNDLVDCRDKVESFRKMVTGMTFSDQIFHISISGGLVEHRDETSAELIKKADDLLYKAKREGRNRIYS
ncbi:MAG: diguanylate cyclase [Spirochaetales bacterium]|nr:diguanylate cyclase [Spirochaetales bacterium]